MIIYEVLDYVDEYHPNSLGFFLNREDAEIARSVYIMRELEEKDPRDINELRTCIRIEENKVYEGFNLDWLKDF